MRPAFVSSDLVSDPVAGNIGGVRFIAGSEWPEQVSYFVKVANIGAALKKPNNFFFGVIFLHRDDLVGNFFCGGGHGRGLSKWRGNIAPLANRYIELRNVAQLLFSTAVQLF